MSNRINIMLLLVLGVISASTRNLWNISDPTDIDYQNNYSQFLQDLSKQFFFTDFLLQAKSDWPAHKEGLAAQKLEQNQNVNKQQYQLENSPSKKKHNMNKYQKKFIWYLEDQSWLDKKNMGIYTDVHNNHMLGNSAELLNPTIQNYNFSIHIVGEHYMIVNDSI